MKRDAIIVVRKFAVCLAVAMGLLMVACCGGDAWYRSIAIITLIVVAGPVVLLVAIDMGRILRRQNLGHAATIATWVPEVLLGSVATIAGAGGLSLAIFTLDSWWQRAGGGFMSLCILSYGASLLFFGNVPRGKSKAS
jgi:hypothetical protein